MKKGSTGATKQSRNISQQKLTIGLDLGDRNSWYRVLDEAGRIQREQRVRTSGKALQEVFGAVPAQSDRTGNRDAFAPGSVACSANWDTK
jgi:transposase